MASTSGAFDNILMNGQEVFKFAVRAVPTVRSPRNSYPSMLQPFRSWYGFRRRERLGALKQQFMRCPWCAGRALLAFLVLIL